jgi:hypothetical protein
MLNYLLSHSEYSFSPQETADLCEAFDLAIAVLQVQEKTSVNWAAEDVRATLAAEIVEARIRGEKDPKQLCDRAVRVAETLFGRG